MANFLTETVTITEADGWVELGSPARQDNFIDIFNESSLEVRLHMGTVAPTGDVGSIPIYPYSNYYFDCKCNTSTIYVKTTGTSRISFVEG